MIEVTPSQLQEPPVKVQDQSREQFSESATTGTDEFDRIKKVVLPAYRAYLEARKGLEEAFREQERQLQEAYGDAERQFRLYEEAIDKAMKAAKTAEQDAMAAYGEEVIQAIDKASLTFKEKMKQVLMECKCSVTDAWNSSVEISTLMKDILGEDSNIRKEK